MADFVANPPATVAAPDAAPLVSPPAAPPKVATPAAPLVPPTPFEAPDALEIIVITVPGPVMLPTVAAVAPEVTAQLLPEVAVRAEAPLTPLHPETPPASAVVLVNSVVTPPVPPAVDVPEVGVTAEPPEAPPTPWLPAVTVSEDAVRGEETSLASAVMFVARAVVPPAPLPAVTPEVAVVKEPPEISLTSTVTPCATCQ
ncbi:UNVERIFIED_CONTAM: hypothetical protein HDU68_000256 [Siphonaria sp. JEL0065]|nr:hypothetical protein HDU68_000256 [Siphonaria sp. JEL0065]